ncbi:hypothetical protein [Johnsonella ignava]|uniref:hypothetical protein n=1 Tax=Johnsonella ignava TaxID=43995 RepID=UPI002FE6F03D
MGKSSLEYSEKLYSQIQEEYGKLVYTYTCHFKMADRLNGRNNLDKMGTDWSISNINRWFFGSTHFK